MPSTPRSIAAFALVAVVAASACTSAVPANPEPPTVAPAPSPTTVPSRAPEDAPDDAAESRDAWLVVGRSGESDLQVILASSQERIARLPAGVPDERWATIVVATPTDGSTQVSELNVAQESPGPSQSIDGSWRLPTIGADQLPVGVSLDGRTVALVEASPSAGSATSRFAILARSLDQEPKIIELRGSFEFDALSPDGSVLYVVEHLPGPPEGHYQVRAVDRATGTLRDGVIVDKLGTGEAMAGWPIGQLRRRDGFVFTLYRGAEHPFIHALSSADGWALCIDLPATGADQTDAARDWGLSPSADGNAVFAVNATLGLAVEVDPADLSVRRTARFDAPASAAISLAKFGHEVGGPVGRRLVASLDGRTLYSAGSGGIVRIATKDLEVSRTFLPGTAVDALGLTHDGRTLYALVHQGGRIVALDSESGELVGQVPGDGFDRLVAVVPW